MRSLATISFCLLLGTVPAWADVIVDVYGAVRTPGLTVVRDRATVRDVIKAAGGAQPNADLSSIKLDLPVTTNQAHLRVPFVGESKGIANAPTTLPPVSPPVPKVADPTSQVRNAISQVRSGGDARQAAVALASRIQPKQRSQVFIQLQEAAADKNVQVRLFAIAFLSETRDPQGMPVLMRALRDEDDEIRSMAGTILPEMAQRR